MVKIYLVAAMTKQLNAGTKPRYEPYSSCHLPLFAIWFVYFLSVFRVEYWLTVRISLTCYIEGINYGCWSGLALILNTPPSLLHGMSLLSSPGLTGSGQWAERHRLTMGRRAFHSVDLSFGIALKMTWNWHSPLPYLKKNKKLPNEEGNYFVN